MGESNHLLFANSTLESTGQAVDDPVGEEICVLHATGEEMCCGTTAEDGDAGEPRNEEADAV